MNTATTPPPPRADFEEVLASMAAVDRLKTRDEILAREADMPGRKADVAARLREAYARQGVAVSDAQIRAGVDAYFSNRLAFQEPPRSAPLLLCNFWVERARLARKTARITGAVLSVALCLYLVVILPIQVYRSAVTSEATRKVAQAASRLHQAENAAEETFRQSTSQTEQAGGKGREELSRAAQHALVDISALKNQTDGEFHRAEDVLSGYLPPEEKIDYGHAKDAEQKVELFYAALAKIEKPVVAMTTLAHKMQELAREDIALNLAWSTFESVSATPGLQDRAREIYDGALNKVSLFDDPSTVRHARLDLDRLSDQSHKLSRLPDALRTAAERVRAIAKDPQALAQAKSGEDQGIAAIASGDLTGAQSQLDSLTELSARLGQEYTLRIVNRPGEYTRFWRYPGRNLNIKNFYVVVEPVDGRGHVVSQAVRSEEDGALRTVSKWAERVDAATYEAVGNDKKDDGIIQKNVFAEKTSGWLNPIYQMGPKSAGGDPAAGRIFRWEYKR